VTDGSRDERNCLSAGNRRSALHEWRASFALTVARTPGSLAAPGGAAVGERQPGWLPRDGRCRLPRVADPLNHPRERLPDQEPGWLRSDRHFERNRWFESFCTHGKLCVLPATTHHSRSCQVHTQTSLPSTSAKIQNARARSSLTSRPPAARAASTRATASSCGTVASIAIASD